MDSVFIINQTDDSALVLWTMVLTFATIALAFVAAFQDVIRGKFKSPKLDVIMEVKAPHCRKTPVQALRKNESSTYIESWSHYYFRFKIKNNGRSSAKNVEVIINDVKLLNGDYVDLSLDNLCWSSLKLDVNSNFLPRIYWDYISPGTFQYCNLGMIVDPAHREEEPGEFKASLAVDINETIFSFAVYWRTNDCKHLIAKGSYTFEIIACCENAKPITKKYLMEITGFWSEDEKEMLEKGFKIINQ